MPTKQLYWITKHCKFNLIFRRHLHYVQGQRTSSGIREYFYYIDHRGQLFLDDARIKNFTSCFKEKKFLKLFFNQLKINETDRYKDEFPFLSPCGLELNFIRCDDLPVVFDKLLPLEESMQQTNQSTHSLIYGGGQILLLFRPAELLVDATTGRVYHPAPKKFGGVGLVGTALAQQLSESFVFERNSMDDARGESINTGKVDIPSHILWNGSKVQLNNDHSVLKKVSTFQRQKFDVF